MKKLLELAKKLVLNLLSDGAPARIQTADLLITNL